MQDLQKKVGLLCYESRKYYGIKNEQALNIQKAARYKNRQLSWLIFGLRSNQSYVIRVD